MKLDDEALRPAFLKGGGELADLIAAFAWHHTVLGPLHQWPAHLRITVSLMLRSGVPMVALFDEPGIMIYNDAYASLSGGRHPRLLGSPVREGWPEVADFNDNVMKVGLAGGTLSYRDQELTLHRSGAPEQVFMNLDYSPVLDDGGKPVGVLAIVVETTAKVRAERRLANERARLHQMFEQAPGFICTLRGPDHLFESVNAAYRQLFDRTLIGKTVREAFPEIEGQGFFELLDDVHRTGKPYRAEAMPARVRRQDGVLEQKHLTFVYQPLFNEAGTVSGVFCEGFDVSETMRAHDELQRTQAWLQEGLQAAHMVAFEWDFVTGQVRYSPNSIEVLGYADSEPSTGFGSIHPDDLPAVRAAIDHARAHSGEFRLVHRRIRPDTGALMWTDSRGRVYSDVQARNRLMRGVVIDVSERVRSEQALREANRRKDEFLAMLAHELRNPLAPIATGSALLAKVPDQVEMVRKTSDLIARQVRHMSELVDDLLDVSRVTRGLIEIERAQVDMKQAMQSALEQARPLIDAKGHVVSTAIPPGDVTVLGDRTRVVQVLVNLLTNGAKYTPPQGELHVELRKEGGRAVVAVRDSGMGIDPELLPHVFDLFTQGERTPDRSQGGLGIGLALVKAIVELHHGEVRAESGGRGMGSCFTIMLPLCEHSRAHDPHPPRPAPKIRPLNILVTDDNVDAAESLALLLRSEGHQVHVCHDGVQALAASVRLTPDVCILDVGLPDITGLEVARKLREQGGQQPALLVALTGYGQPHDFASTAEAGFDHHLVKPVKLAALEAVLERWAGR